MLELEKKAPQILREGNFYERENIRMKNKDGYKYHSKIKNMTLQMYDRYFDQPEKYQIKILQVLH